ncbi:hypothetical protein C5167_033907 [Papaver somniferum]|uniref:Uncharacterized protein n=1 Tax=Papaver somniferum TaxID=3469 RepID=A0A4Y7KEH4_PAPSO|nr:hypothetical protein C5167_033907 [Papaver somniferum]
MLNGGVKGYATIKDLREIIYRWQGNWRLIRYVFINNNKGLRPQRSKQVKFNEEGNMKKKKKQNKKKSVRGGTICNTGETDNTSNVGILSLNYDTIAIEILSILPVKSQSHTPTLLT